MKEYLLYCTRCNEYTLLGKFLEKEKRFQGEHSFVYNRHTENGELLCRFLIDHVGHPLQSIENETKKYIDILQKGKRYREQDIDRYVEEALREEKFNDVNRSGYALLPLYLLREMFKENAKDISNTPAKTKAASQFMLGKEEGFKAALRSVEKLIEKTVISS